MIGRHYPVSISARRPERERYLRWQEFEVLPPKRPEQTSQLNLLRWQGRPWLGSSVSGAQMEVIGRLRRMMDGKKLFSLGS